MADGMWAAVIATAGTLAGAGLAYAGTLRVADRSTRAAREVAADQRAHEVRMAENQRDRDEERARASYIAETLLEVQIAVVNLQRAMVAFADLQVAALGPGDGAGVDQGFERTYWPFVDALILVEVLSGRLGDHRVRDGVGVQLQSARNILRPPDERPAGWSDVDQLRHFLDEGLAGGQRALDVVAEDLAELPPPSTYRPVTPWTIVRPGEGA